MGLQVQRVVRLARGQLQQPVRQSAAVVDPAGTVGRLPEAVHCHELLTRISPPLGQFAGAGIGFRRLDRTEPFGREQRQAAGQLQFDLPPLPSRTLGECREHCKTTLEMAYRL